VCKHKVWAGVPGATTMPSIFNKYYGARKEQEMTKKVLFVAVLALLIFAIGTLDVSAKINTPKTEKARRLEAMQQYQFLFNKRYQTVDEKNVQSVSGGRVDLPSASAGTRTTASPGAIAGFSYYDVMRNSATGRSIDWRYTPQFHMTWTYLPTSDQLVSRQMGYNMFDADNNNWPLGAGIGNGLPNTSDRTGFGGLAVRLETVSGLSGAIISAHTTRTGLGTKTETYYNDPGFDYGDFGLSNRISVADETPITGGVGSVIWPIVEHQVFGSDTVTYVAAMEDFTSDPDRGDLVVFRKTGNTEVGTWTAFSPGLVGSQCYSLATSRVSGKVAVVWLIRCVSGESGNSPFADAENDVVYNESTDMGATWGAMQNVTSYDVNIAGYRAWVETASLYDLSDNLHIIWNGGIYTPADGAGSRQCRLFHWADNTDLITTVYNGEWVDFGLQFCVPGSNVMNASKFSISQCDTNLYVIWQQANDPPNGVFDDCGSATSAAQASSANNELFLSVSVGLSGVSWDAARNLTDSYTPDCDTLAGGINGDCDNDAFATMSRYGMDNTDFPGISFTNAAQALTVDPSGSYTGTQYLDVLYLNDQFPGVGVYEAAQGPLTRNDMKWFRLPCVDPIVSASLFMSQTTIGYPNYVMHGQDTTITLTLENNGNTALNITSINPDETSGPLGWLAVSATSLSIPPAINNVDSIDVTLNDGLVVNSPGTIVALNGVIEFVSNAPTSPDTFTIVNFLVADTVVGQVWQTLSTSCIALTVSNNGNMGNAGNDGVGGANMNFAADCDNADTIPGDATVYLYDASPVVLKVSGSDTLASWSIFADGFASPNGFKPVESDPEPQTFTGTGYEAIYSGQFVTADSTLTLEKTVFFPTHVDSCNFLVQAICITSTDGSAQSGLAIGEAWDWDIPSDTAVRNVAGSDPFSGTVWLQGGEWNEAVGDGLECQNNDARFGGAGLIGYTDAANGTLNTADPANFYTALNEDFVTVAGGFVPGELYTNMQTNNGFTAVPSSTIEDQHMVMTVFKNYSLAAGDTLTIWVAMATVENGTSGDLIQAIQDARAWFNAHPNLPCRPSGFVSCCVGETGDLNSDGNRTLTDLTQLVNFLFVTFVPPACMPAANTNGDAACAVTLTDLTRLVNKLFVTFVPCQPCASFDNQLCP
jgi:hypothetical protein